jgi:hypothetical protein
MDIDNIQLNALTDEGRKKLMKEGRCFQCRQRGHMSRACLKKQNVQVNQTDVQKGIKKQTCTTEIVDDRDNMSKIKSKDTAVSGQAATLNATKMMPDTIMHALEALSKEQCDEVLNRILIKGKDF